MDIPFLLVSLNCLLLPGFALAKILKLDKNLLLNSVALSYVIFFLVFWVCCIFQIIESALMFLMLSIALLSSVYLIILVRKGMFLSIRVIDSCCVFGLVGTIFIYHALFGAASDLPGDLYTHMERFQLISDDLHTASPNQALQTIGLPLQSYLWYYFVAMVASFTSISSGAVIESVAALSVCLLLISVYSFACSVFHQHRKAWLVSILTCLFLALHFGVNVFAFIRYYSLGPVMIGLCLYLAAIALLLDFIRDQSIARLIKFGALFIIIIVVSASNHRQEALFILIMSLAIFLVYVMTMLIRFKYHCVALINLKIWCFALVVMLIGLGATYSYAHLNLERNPNVHWRLWEFASGWGLIPDITTLNLKKQFIEVITLWGCLVYALFFLNLRRYINNTFLMAGMLSPMLTILNPFFVDFFLRFEETDVLWRLCYLIPIHFVAADLFILYVNKLKSGLTIHKVFPLSVVVLLVTLLLPVENTWLKIHFSRFPHLTKTPIQTSYLYYSDVTDFLNSIEKNTIVTDVISGYLIEAMTKHDSPRRKFFRDYKYNDFSFNQYDETTFSSYRGFLLLINQRSQIKSELGRLSGHWSEFELENIAYYYPPALFDFIEQRPQMFSELWSSKGITIYRIN